MPSGKTHSKLTLILQSLATPAFVFLPWEAALGLHIGIAVTQAVNPDNDVTTNRLPLISRWMGFEAYKNLVPHRFGLYGHHWKGPIWWILIYSHIPFIGTFTRFLLLLIPIIVISLLFNAITYLPPQLLLNCYLGMSASDTLHVVADILTSDVKKMTKQYWFSKERKLERKRNAKSRSNSVSRKRSKKAKE